MSTIAISTPSSSIPGPRICLSGDAQLMIFRATSYSNSKSYSKLNCKLSRKCLRSKPPNQLLFKIPINTSSKSSSKRLFRPVMESQDCTVKMEVDVPVSVAYDCYLDREAIPKWMPFISTVKVLEDKPDQSRWTLKYKAFGRDIEFSWLARNLQPIPNQKIHWRSLEGLPNSGAVRFYPRGTSSCLVELTVSYEVPQLLAPVASLIVNTCRHFNLFFKACFCEVWKGFQNMRKAVNQSQPTNPCEDHFSVHNHLGCYWLLQLYCKVVLQELQPTRSETLVCKWL
ncbi:uncharacterized protein [Spinacia oleracea]|uniref:Uncharacterized protein isoform X2 n=1 Tax=Spinacia oleracea TaxID=3562 RepID=A0ABM3QKU6_SPIOL|nr:uncharacterized protein LOC110776377 isoform X2 [Spinacia oleracea]